MKSMLLVLIFRALFYAAPTFAQPGEIDAKKTSPHFISAGLGVWHFDYAEDLDPPLKSTESGFLPGVQVGYRYDDGSIYSLFASLAYSQAKVHYDGSTQAGKALELTTHRRALDVAVGADYIFLGSRAENFTSGFFDVGYHSWWRGEKEEDERVIRELYTWNYISLGAKSRYVFSPQWDVTASAAVRMPINATITMYFSENYDQIADVEDLDLGSKPGLRLEATGGYALDENMKLLVTPWFEFSALGKSAQVRLKDKSGRVIVDEESGMAFGVHEPASRTYQYGLVVGVERRL